jgi:hypothetical protein
MRPLAHHLGEDSLVNLVLVGGSGLSVPLDQVRPDQVLPVQEPPDQGAAVPGRVRPGASVPGLASLPPPLGWPCELSLPSGAILSYVFLLSFRRGIHSADE